MTLTEVIQQGELLLADGATATLLQSMGLPIGEPPEGWILQNPDAVREVARLYTEAGSDLLYTNTFGGNRLRLKRVGLANRVAELNHLAVQLAREGIAEASNRRSRPWLAGSMGPTGELLEPYGDLAPELAYEAFAEQAKALTEAQLDAIVCETFTDLQEILICLQAVRSITQLPVIASMSFEPSGRTMMGVTPQEAIVILAEAGATVVGANCSVGPELVEKVMREMKAARPNFPLLAKPNAGMPRLTGGKPVYPVTPEEMAAFGSRMKELGVAILGGCCGTTPDHIQAMAKTLKDDPGTETKA